MNKELKNYAIILASGKGTRFGKDLPKQFEKIGDKTILERTLDVFEQNKAVDKIILVITPKYREPATNILKDKYSKLLQIIEGGKTRKESSFIGISAVSELEANVFIHDCARPFLSQKVLNNCIMALKDHDAVNTAIHVTDTIIKVEDGFIKEIPQRQTLMASQTPQCFRLSLIKKAHELARNDDTFTDDCGIVLKYNLADIHIVEGERENIKITYPQDLDIANIIYKKYFSDRLV